MAAALGAMSWSCETAQPPPPPDADLGPPSVEALAAPHNEFGQLQIFITDQTSAGRTIMLRGLIRNPYPETVEGVRLVFRFLSTQSLDAKVLDQFQREYDTRLAGGAQTALRWDIQTMYAGAAPAGFTLQAFAIKRGGQELPPPPGWKG